MHMTAEEMLNCIPKFECSDGQNILFSETFLKNKLHNALKNPTIINLARGEGRSIAVERLEQEDRQGGQDYIFTVDIFNEGVDIPAINQVVMLRPTEFAIYFFS